MKRVRNIPNFGNMHAKLPAHPEPDRIAGITMYKVGIQDINEPHLRAAAVKTNGAKRSGSVSWR